MVIFGNNRLIDDDNDEEDDSLVFNQPRHTAHIAKPEEHFPDVCAIKDEVNLQVLVCLLISNEFFP